MNLSPRDEAWRSWIEAPLILDGPDTSQWDNVADIVVVGFGGAGACAAIEAAEHNADVLVIERFAGGGATRLSGGVCYGGGGTQWQQEAGIVDDADSMFAYLNLQLKSAISEETLRRFCDESRSDLEWLAGHGVLFSATPYLQKTSYPPPRHYLYFSGNEKLTPYRDAARPAPRGHRAAHPSHPPGMTGFAYFDALRGAVERLGVRTLCHAPVSRLIINGEGDVIGVEARVMEGAARRAHETLLSKWKPLNPLEAARRRKIQRSLERLEAHHGTRRCIRARSGVILSAGGFIHNWELVNAHAPIDHANTVRLGAPGCDGAGIRLGQSVGAAVSSMDHLDNSRGLRPDIFTRGMLLDAQGERFINEEAYSGTIGDIAIQRGAKKLWLIVDRTLRREAFKVCTDPKQPGGFFFFGLPVLLNFAFATKSAATIEDLARKVGMDPVKAAAALRDYNQAATGRAPDAFGKDSASMQAMPEGRYYAVDQSPGNRFTPLLAFTVGGLVVDEVTGGVKREDGSLISGLYAAGRTAIGLCSNSYISGMSLADGVFSGRRAAKSATAQLQRARTAQPARG